MRRVGSLFEKLVGGSNFLEEMADHSPSLEALIRKHWEIAFYDSRVKAGDYVDWGDLRISFWNPPGKLEIGHQPNQKEIHQRK